MFAWGGIEKALPWLMVLNCNYAYADEKGNKHTAELTDIGILLLTTFWFMLALFSALWFCI